jgi:Mrp family chromosome partitioning ATPase
LALTLANDGNDRVLLVDANFGRPTAQKLLSLNPATGLADMLATGQGEVAAVQRNLYFLPSGRLGEEMSGNGFSLSMSNVIRCLKERPYRFVLFDTEAVMDTSVALRICHMMDSVILVIDADKTDRAAVARATQILNRGGNRLLGIVFNQKRSYTPRWLSLSN